jgi:hypothetical protein
MSLYARLLGDDWQRLSRSVQSVHAPGSAAGTLRVVRGTRWLARLIGWLFRLPRAAESAALELYVEATGTTEIWERRVGGITMRSRQHVDEAGTLVETFGPTECGFRLRVQEDGLVFEQVWARLRIGPVRVRFPAPLAPHVEATALSCERAMQVNVRISIRAVGLLLEYSGAVTPTRETT